MLKKILRFYQTVKYLKPIQIRYQVWYRLQNKFFPVRYPNGLNAPRIQKLKLSTFPNQYVHYIGDYHFQFLNLKKDFEDKINWNYLGHGKLWAYHLNYFDYLHQPEMDWETGSRLMKCFLQNPQNRPEGVEPYPISLRTINWIKFLAKHDQYPQEIVDSLYAQYKVLTKKIEYHLLGNHLLENGFSFLFGAVFFQDEKLIYQSRKILKTELNEQILKDGAHFELSPMYHVILLHRALDGYNLLINNKHKFQDLQDQLEAAIQKMVNWLNTITFSNGDIPMLNDSTGGQALESKEVLNYAQQFGFKPQKIKLKESGYRKFEEGDFELVTDVGEVGPTYQPGHAHSDTLSFVLYHQGNPVIVDRGISTYEKNERRLEERGTNSHNTIMIDLKEQTDVYDAFKVGKRASPKILLEKSDFITATHDGYKSLDAYHQRNWAINSKEIEIIDMVNIDNCSCKAVFHFHPKVCFEQISDFTFKVNDLEISFDFNGQLRILNYKYCCGFNNIIDSTKLVIEFKTKLITNIKKI